MAGHAGSKLLLNVSEDGENILPFCKGDGIRGDENASQQVFEHILSGLVT